MCKQESNKLELAFFCIENVAKALGIPENVAYFDELK